MLELCVADGAASKGWQALVLQEMRNIVSRRPWSRDMFLRGSLAQGSEDFESDIDLVVTVAEDEFEAAINDLTDVLPQSLPGRLPPWVDGLVRDFGGIGFVYLIQAGKKKWGQVDIYLLPHGRRQRMLDLEFALPLCSRDALKAYDDSMAARVDVARRHHEQLAARDLRQAVLACYVAAFLLRKRLMRRDRLQTFADTYATAKCLKDLLILACYPDEFGWRGMSKVAESSPDPDLVRKVLATFTQQDLVDQPAGLADRVAGLEKIVAMLAPVIWREHGESLRSLGRHLRSSSHLTPVAKPGERVALSEFLGPTGSARRVEPEATE